MLFRYVGSSGIRIIGNYQWDASNGFVTEVADPELILNLLSYPLPEFEVAANEPLLAQVNGDLDALLDLVQQKFSTGENNE